mgnify:CR=1 FL=1
MRRRQSAPCQCELRFDGDCSLILFDGAVDAIAGKPIEMCSSEGVGINEVQNFGKYRVTGPGARAWLDRVLAGRIPASSGARWPRTMGFSSCSAALSARCDALG